MWPFIRQNSLNSALAELDSCTLPKLLDLDQAQRVLVFAPHPDDETLGCGGTLARLAARCPVKVVLVTDGGGGGGLPDCSASIRQEEFALAIKTLGISDCFFMNQPDGAFTADAAFEALAMQLMRDYRPNWVFLPSPLDYHRDHVRITASLAPLCLCVESVSQLLFYEIWAPVPATHVVDITEQWPVKLKALGQHKTAMACGDYERAFDGLNRYRSLYLEGRSKWAEAFWCESVNHQNLKKEGSYFSKLQHIALDLLRRLR
jgi:LmbE family N-acetylglucosaminyl deacetylase